MRPMAGDAFPTTHWTLILAAKSSPEARRAALTQLMQTYWRPLYVFFRRKGLDGTAAQDAVQDLAVQLLERAAIEKLTPEKGRLRGYLRVAAANLLANRHERDVAQKRGAGAVAVPLDDALAERLARDDAESPEVAFERAWAQAVMQRALQSLEAEFTSGQRTGPFEVVALYFGPGVPPPYREVAQQHGMSLPQLKAFLHRARVRYRELVSAEVAQTVSSPAEVEAEVGELVRVLS